MKKKRRPRNAFYSVYNVNTDELIIQGTVEQICERLDITKSNICKAVNSNQSQIVRRKYIIYYDGIDDEI